jgi:decaprenyl-phosphate phosphoribosyltransferase
MNVSAYIKIARFDHWIKQLFILPGFWLALVMVGTTETAWHIAITVFLGLFSTCAAASANYCINEWLDSKFDKFHPFKKNRPLVLEKINPFIVLIEYLVFFVLSLVAASNVSIEVMLLTAVFLVLGILYNVPPIRTKDIPYIDVLSESLNNAIRLIIGWFCVTNVYQPPSSIVCGYWMGGAFLMAAKRFAEYRMIGDPSQAKLYRKSFGTYNEISLLLSTVFYGFLSVFFCGVFLIKYRIELLIFIPFLCGLFCYYLGLCFKPDSAAQKPEKLFREKGLMLYAGFLIALFIALYYINIPVLERFLQFNSSRLPQ